jgi:arginase family enzyme
MSASAGPDAVTFLRSPRGTVADLTPGSIAVIGVPHDATKISRRGAAEGPSAIRRATAMFGVAVEDMAGGEVVDIDLGKAYRYRQPSPLVDLGDLAVDGDAETVSARVKQAVRSVVEVGALPLTFGGDHFTTFGCVLGLREGLDRASRGSFAYLHIDLHLDLADVVPGFGRFASGTPLRRLIEAGAVDPRRCVIFGAESFAHRNEWDFACSHGINVVSLKRLREGGLRACLDRALGPALEGSEGLYASIDIDAVARTYAPGTGNQVGVAGFTPDELLETMRGLHGASLVGADLVEVAPRWDPTERTAGLAVSALTELLWPRLFDEFDPD